MKHWNFSAPPNAAVIANRKIIQGDWIAHVFHDAEDAGWQFHNSAAGPLSEKDAVVVSLSEIVNADPSISELSDLPPGWQAWRKSPSSPWERARTEISSLRS